MRGRLMLVGDATVRIVLIVRERFCSGRGGGDE